MTQKTCKCGRVMPANWDECSRCRRGRPRPAPQVRERDLNRCTVCGERFANRGLLSIHVRKKHGTGED